MAQHNLFENIDGLFQKAYKHYNKTENAAAQDVGRIKKWLETQPHLPEMMPDTHIRNYLVMNKFKIEKTKTKIDNYYTIRSELPDFFDQSNPELPNLQKFLECHCIHPLVHDLSRVYLHRLKAGHTFSPKVYIVASLNITEVCFFEDCIFEDIHIVDLANFSFNDLTKLTPNVLAKVATLYEKVYSFRFKGFYLINAPAYVSKIVTILKPLLKPKIFERIHVCTNEDILQTIFTNDTLPRDYGGKGPSFDEMTEMIRSKFREYQDRFEKLDKMRVDESLRPDKLVDDEVLGFHGTFRKLDLD